MHIWALGLSCETPVPPDLAAGARTRQPENSKRAHFRAPALQTPKFHGKTPKRKKERTWVGEGKESAKFQPPTIRGPYLDRFPPGLTQTSTRTNPAWTGAPTETARTSSVADLSMGFRVSQNLGPPAFGPPNLRGHHPSGPLRGSTLRGLHPSGPHPSGPHFFWVWASILGASTLWGPHPWWSKNSTSQNWLKSKLAEVEIGRSRLRSFGEEGRGWLGRGGRWGLGGFWEGLRV